MLLKICIKIRDLTDCYETYLYKEQYERFLKLDYFVIFDNISDCFVKVCPKEIEWVKCVEVAE